MRAAAVTARIRSRLRSAHRPVLPSTIDFRDLETLPPPVRRYLRAALTDGQSVVTEAHLRHHGTFNLRERGDFWRPFRSEQLVVTHRPGFDWQARISALPGLPLQVRDAYVEGEGILRAALLGVIPLADMPTSPELAVGELMRFLAEAVWYPTVLANGEGVRWAAAGERSALATLSDGGTSATLSFEFDDSGLVQSVRTENRPRAVRKSFVPTAWEGRFWNYGDVDGMQVPRNGEVAWILEGEPCPYWRGEIEELSYTFAA